MAKTKSTFFCQNCGNQSTRWLGKCPACNEWNTYIEEVIVSKDNRKKGYKKGDKSITPKPINQISLEKEERIPTQSVELDRVLGGGLVSGSIILIGGEPGIGKSTLLLQVALKMKGMKILYVSGEESHQQLKMRADRIGLNNPECYILNETFTGEVFRHIGELSPELIIIDSIQTLNTDTIDSSAGSISQIRETAAELQRFAKTYNLKLMDFSPVLETYFAANPEDKIVSLPIEISVHGTYLDAGKFIENWHQLAFYLIPEEIKIERVDADENQLDVTVMASLYTWNE